MAAGATEAAGEGKAAQGTHSPRGTPKLRAGQASEGEVERFFLAKAGMGNGDGAPEFSKELPGEPEAIVESLKTGLTYFVVSEWRGIADLSGRRPQLGREAAAGHPKAGL